MATAEPNLIAKSTIRKRSVSIGGHKTSVSLEDAFWEALAEIARQRGMPAASLIEQIDRDRLSTNLSSGIRLFVLCQARGGGLKGLREAEPRTDLPHMP